MENILQQNTLSIFKAFSAYIHSSSASGIRIRRSKKTHHKTYSNLSCHIRISRCPVSFTWVSSAAFELLRWYRRLFTCTQFYPICAIPFPGQMSLELSRFCLWVLWRTNCKIIKFGIYWKTDILEVCYGVKSLLIHHYQ